MGLIGDLLEATTGASDSDVAAWLPVIQEACQAYDITSHARQCAFLAQLGVESARLTALEENLNYRASGLLATWPTRFTSDTAAQYAHNPEMIGNIAYAGRGGNGNIASGDGYRYRGRGLLQVTFKNNYASVGTALGLNLVGHPELLLDRQNAANSAAYFFSSRGCNQLADTQRFTAICGLINCGSAKARADDIHGYADRVAYYTAGMRL